MERVAKLGFGKNLNHCNSKNSSICFQGKRALNQKIGTKIDTRIYCHVSVFLLFGCFVTLNVKLLQFIFPTTGFL